MRPALPDGRMEPIHETQMSWNWFGIHHIGSEWQWMGRWKVQSSSFIRIWKWRQNSMAFNKEDWETGHVTRPIPKSNISRVGADFNSISMLSDEYVNPRWIQLISNKVHFSKNEEMCSFGKSMASWYKSRNDGPRDRMKPLIYQNNLIKPSKLF